MDIIIHTANDPSILGASVHLLYVGKLDTHVTYDS